MACVTWKDKNKSILNENFNMEKKFFSIFIIRILHHCFVPNIELDILNLLEGILFLIKC